MNLSEILAQFSVCDICDNSTILIGLTKDHVLEP
jgi:hypothetical protein